MSDALRLPPLLRQKRWWVLALLFLVTVVNFVDRQTLSVLAPIIRDTFHLSNEQYGTIVSWFQFGMVVGEFPMGALMDRIGVRAGLTLAVLWWSVGNGLHALAQTVWEFRLFRFWLGTGECGNYSGGNKVVAQWFPVKERALAIGVFNSASMLGSFIAPFLVIPVAQRYGWRAGFLVPSTLGLFWVIAWWLVYRQPADDKRLSAAEAAYIAEGRGTAPEPAPSSAQLLRLKQTWGLMLCRFWVGPVVQFYIYWMPSYFRDVRHLSVANASYFGAVTFLFGDIGSVAGGAVAGWLIARGMRVSAARRSTLLGGAILCFAGAVVPMLANIPLAIAAISIVLLGHTFLSANMFASMSDLFPNAAVARVTGLTGVASGISGIFFPWLTGVIVDRMSYAPVFLMGAVMPLVGVLILFWAAGDYRRVAVARP
ncbi:MAG TPA: MFS transporter [Vicinamibacterales bacterium]|jgi:ACS family hexuronate transporter-like MFS transporter|nr:MFS transporter [Vicinamibacterales bacterium]